MRQMHTKLLGKRVLLFVAVGLVGLFLAGCAHNNALPTAVDNEDDMQQDEEMNNEDTENEDADTDDTDMDDSDSDDTSDDTENEDTDMDDDDAEGETGDTADSQTGDDSADDDEELVADVMVTIEGSNFMFSEETIEVNEGDVVQIAFKSIEGYHDWVIDEFDAATQRVTTGGTTTVTFVADEAGSFEYYCSVGNHREQGMVGTLIVN